MHETRLNEREGRVASVIRILRKACVSVVAVLAGIAVLSGVLLADSDKDLDLAPLFTLPNLDGDDVSLAEYRGSVVILDFWATWCMPCTKTFPELHALQQAYADRGVVLLVVSLDKSAEDARDYLVENEFATDNVLWGSLKEAREVKELYSVCGIAHTLVIDRDGHIRFSGHPVRLTAEVIEAWL